LTRRKRQFPQPPRSRGQPGLPPCDLAAGLKRRAEAIAEVIIVENGCPHKQALAMQALSAVALLEGFAPLAENHKFEELRKGLRGGDVIVRKVPIGVSVGITPWNAPVFLASVKLTGAIAAGNPLILKPKSDFGDISAAANRQDLDGRDK
jgi:acyl-CoA reductase-like NAD-dependent aldehyde dehydrogenase